MRRWILAAALVAGCGGSAPAPQAPDPTPAEPAATPAAAAPATAPTHESLLALLRASTYDLSSKPDSDCAYMATTDNAVLGPAIEHMLTEADTQSSSCKPADGGGYTCTTALARQHANDEGVGEWSVSLEYQVNGETIDWSTLRCQLAG